jgi:predicted transcriptional regulator
MTRAAMKTYLEANLAEAVARLAASQRRSESAIIADAVRARFANGSNAAGQAGAETQKRQLNRLEARFDKLLWEMVQSKQMLLLFVRVWLEHNPPLDPEIEDSAAASAEARFERFLDILAERLAKPADDDLLDRPGSAPAPADGQPSLFGEGFAP